MSDPAKLHNLGLKLAEARREVIRSRTVVRIIRSAYRLDDLGASIETIPARFLMLVVGSMTCDCAAIFYCDNITKNDYRIIESVGCSNLSDKKFITIKILDNFLIINKGTDDYIESDITRFMNAEKILCVSDTNTGYAIAVGFHYNSTIDHQFDLNDQETMKDALAVYTDVLERRRTRRLLDQTRQNAEAREAEINDVISSTTKRMLSIIDLIENNALSLSNNIDNADVNNKSNISMISKSLIELKDIVSVASEITNDQPAPIVMEKEWVLLSEFLTSVVRNTQQACIQQGVDVQLKLSETKIYVWLDRIWMEMILNTFLSEALANIIGEGELLVEVSQREDKALSISIQGRGQPFTIEPDRAKSSSKTMRDDQISASIRRLVDAHNANFVIDRQEQDLICIYLYINRSECEER